VHKAPLRTKLLAGRDSLGERAMADGARSIRDALLMLPEAEMAGTVAAYVSVGTEPGTRSLLFAMWKRGTYVLLPRLLADGDLDWASYEGPDSLVPGPHGLLEPGEASRGVDAVRTADLVIVPSLAVDFAGNRLGRGGGSYDRVLARVGPGIPTIAPLYDSELLDEPLPSEPHDRQVRAAITPSRGLTRLPRLPDSKA
jgi:5-formyltetrahydrofolate cyclo-ligase